MEREVQTEFIRAVEQYRRGDMLEAAAICESLVRASKRHLSALHLLSVIELQRDQPLRSLELVDAALAIEPTNAVLLLCRGNALAMLSHHQLAVECYAGAIRGSPELVEAHCNRGNSELQLGRYEAAIQSYRYALAIEPHRAEVHNGLGQALAARACHTEALASYAAAIELRSDYGLAHYNRANSLLAMHSYSDAVLAYGRAIALLPDFANAHNNLGNALSALGHFDEALQSYRSALAIRPMFPSALRHCGIVLRQLRRWHEALSAYEQALQLDPDDVEALSGRGVVLNCLRRFDEAVASCDRALEIDPDHPGAHCNRGMILMEVGRLTEALACFDRALSLKPDFYEAWCNRGLLLHERRFWPESIDSFSRAIALKPQDAEARFFRSLALLTIANFAQGWQDYEWRWKLRSAWVETEQRHFAQPRWSGKELLIGKTIVLHSEQGLGDTLQFCRYATLIAQLGARVVLEVQPTLKALLTSLVGVAQVCARGEELPRHDYYCPLMSLPGVLGTTLSSIPGAVPYLTPPADRTQYWHARMRELSDGRMAVGLIWSGGFTPNEPERRWVTARRNIPLEKFATLRHPAIDFVSLQKGQAAESELDALTAAGWRGPQLRRIAGELRDFADTAALMMQLDLVISVDTSSAHLAGALGKPVWILNRYDSCWRWLDGRADSPWYPTARLYFQSRAGDWDGVMARVRADLDGFVDAAR
jgi:tetratricopeptide (TPR) repeat protein